MGVLGCCGKLCALATLLFALLIGYLSTQLHPLGTVFSTIFKLKGIGKPGTEPVPDDLLPMARPQGEIFFDLPGGTKMPANGIGMCCRPSAYDPISVHRTVLWFLLQGGRLIDTASLYLNHHSIGLAIKDAVARGVPRKEIFLTTKVFGDHFGYDIVIKRAEDMLKELGVDYLDLVLLHSPIAPGPALVAKFFYTRYLGGGSIEAKMGSDPDQHQLRIDTWKGLSTLREKGLIRNLGVSNFNVAYMKELQALTLAPIAANQMQFHPWAPSSQKETVAYCHQHRIAVTGYFSLGGNEHKDKTLDLEALNSIAKAHGRRPAQILLRWSLQKNVSIIPGTGNHKHMADNLATYGFSLPAADMDRLDSMASLPISDDFMFFDL